MSSRTTLCGMSMFLLAVTPAVAAAQEAAESAVILGGIGRSAQGGARSAGGAIRDAISRAGTEISAANGQMQNRAKATTRGGGTRRHTQAVGGILFAGRVDPLNGTDAQTFSTDSGLTFRVSGVFRPAMHTVCVANCTPATH